MPSWLMTLATRGSMEAVSGANVARPLGQLFDAHHLIVVPLGGLEVLQKLADVHLHPIPTKRRCKAGSARASYHRHRAARMVFRESNKLLLAAVLHAQP
jgi:hypothetical protein